MDYSLLSKFRGAWLGSCIAANVKEQTLASSHILDFLAKVGEQKSNCSVVDKQINLVERQWQSLCSHWQESSTITLQKLKHWQVSPKAHDLALLAIPVILFYHDYWSYLSNFLFTQAEKHQLKQPSIDCLLIWAYTIKLGLRGELDQPSLSHKIIREANISNPLTCQWLISIETLSKHGDSSQKLLKDDFNLDEVVISLSLFYFLNNKHNFKLSTQQGLELADSLQVILAALSGALSGAYNGLSIIPSSWRISQREKNHYQFVISKTEDIMREWSGSDFTTKSNKHSDFTILSSTGVLQPRHELKIISQ